MSTDERISRHEAARRLGVSLQTVDRYVAAGDIHATKNPRTKRVSLLADDVERVRVERESL